MLNETERWKPSVTVAAVVVRADRYLIVEESIGGRVVLNQPAGHLEPGESLIEAVKREVLEETGWIVEPTSLIGVYRHRVDSPEQCLFRFAFAADPLDLDAGRALDPAILGVRWMSRAEIEAARSSHRTPLVLACLRDYLDGAALPLSCIHD